MAYRPLSFSRLYKFSKWFKYGRKAFYLFTQFPVSVGKVMDELSSSLGPYEIGMGVGSAHLLLSAIALRVEEGAVASTALG